MSNKRELWTGLLRDGDTVNIPITVGEGNELTIGNLSIELRRAKEYEAELRILVDEIDE